MPKTVHDYLEGDLLRQACSWSLDYQKNLQAWCFGIVRIRQVVHPIQIRHREHYGLVQFSASAGTWDGCSQHRVRVVGVGWFSNRSKEHVSHICALQVMACLKMGRLINKGNKTILIFDYWPEKADPARSFQLLLHFHQTILLTLLADKSSEYPVEESLKGLKTKFNLPSKPPMYSEKLYQGSIRFFSSCHLLVTSLIHFVKPAYLDLFSRTWFRQIRGLRIIDVCWPWKKWGWGRKNNHQEIKFQNIYVRGQFNLEFRHVWQSRSHADT